MRKALGVFGLTTVLIFGMVHMAAATGGTQSTINSSGAGTELSPQESLTNSLGMTFNLIPAGVFMMGSPEGEPGRRADETRHQVTLTQPFYIQTTEVTQGQWKAVMKSNPSRFSDCGDDCPVERVSWNMAQDFIAELNKLGQGTYRLPTEAEWEYAARAGSTTALANGDIEEIGSGYDPNLDAMGWYVYNSDGRTHPVARKKPNAWGLYDMHGNVWEWVQDGANYYERLPSENVTDPQGTPTGPLRVLRGGSIYDDARSCRSANRHFATPESRPDFGLGFRLVREH